MVFNTNIAVAGKWGPMSVSSMYFPLKMGDFPGSYVSLPEGTLGCPVGS